MKKIILAAILFFSFHGYSQGLVQFGPMISANITSVSSSGSYAADNSGTAMIYGAFIRANLAVFYGQAELGYGSTEFSTNNADYKLSGANTNLIIGWKIIPLGKLGNVRVFGGYNWAKFSDISNSLNQNLDHITSSNSGLIGGLGVDLWKLTFDTRYIKGFSDIDSSSNKLELSNINLCVGFKF